MRWPRKSGPITMSLLLLTMISTTSCGLLPSGSQPVKPECVGDAPIYLSEGAIAALKPFRLDRELIAKHNSYWEDRCEP